MPLKLNKSAFEKLVVEDIKWLKENAPHSCERMHILAILRDCVEVYYPEVDDAQQVSRVDPGVKHTQMTSLEKIKNEYDSDFSADANLHHFIHVFEGYMDFVKYRQSAECPYPHNSARYIAWLRGTSLANEDLPEKVIPVIVGEKC